MTIADWTPPLSDGKRIAVCLGLLGVIVRRNLLVIYMSLELMLNAANLALVAFSRFNNNLDGQVFVFFIITVAAAEVAVGLALIVALYRKRQTAHVEDLTALRLRRMNPDFSPGSFYSPLAGGGLFVIHRKASQY